MVRERIRQLYHATWIKNPPWLAKVAGVVIVIGSLGSLGGGILLAIVLIVQSSETVVGFTVLAMSFILLAVIFTGVHDIPVDGFIGSLYAIGMPTAFILGYLVSKPLIASLLTVSVLMTHLVYGLRVKRRLRAPINVTKSPDQGLLGGQAADTIASE